MRQDLSLLTLISSGQPVPKWELLPTQEGISLNLYGTRFSAYWRLSKEEARKLMNGLQAILSIQDRKQTDAWKGLAISLALRDVNESNSSTPAPVEPAPSSASQLPWRPVEWASLLEYNPETNQFRRKNLPYQSLIQRDSTPQTGGV